MIDHIEAARKIKEAGNKVCESKDTAREFLIRIGILNKDGSPSTIYYGACK